jgi:alpha-tubulin suppressor-like RCC1 family protein
MPFDTGLAIDTDGQAWGWGADKDGELCVGSTTRLTLPVELPFSDVTLVTGAGGHALYDADNTLQACGYNGTGALGDGSHTSTTTPTTVIDLPSQRLVALLSSYQGSGALLAGGSYYDWGLNSEGQLGNGGTSDSPRPVRVPLEAAVSQVSQGGSTRTNGQTIAILSDGSVWAWGAGGAGQLGDGGRENAPSPIQLTAPDGVTWTSVVSGGASSYALDSGGDIWAWGENGAGQLGTGDTSDESTPVEVTGTRGFGQVSSTAANAAAY